MKRLIPALFGSVFIMGCATSMAEPHSITQQCEILFSDPDIAIQMARELKEVAVSDMSACYAVKAEADGEAEIRRNVLDTLNATLPKHDGDAEAALGEIRAAIKADSTAYPFTDFEFMRAGRQLDMIVEDMRNTGTCPVS